jgi:hypothetical protein
MKHSLSSLQDSIYRKLRTSSSTTACSIRKFYLLLALFAFYSPSGFATCTAGNEVVVTFPDVKFNLNNIPLSGNIGSEIITNTQDIFICTGNTTSYNRRVSDRLHHWRYFSTTNKWTLYLPN